HFAISAFCSAPRVSGVCCSRGGTSCPRSASCRRTAGSANALMRPDIAPLPTGGDRNASATAEQVVEAGHEAVVAQSHPVALGRAYAGRSAEVVAAAELGMHEFEAERVLARDLELDAAADGPAVMHRRSLQRRADGVVLDAGVDVAGGEAAFDV